VLDTQKDQSDVAKASVKKVKR